MKCLIGHLSDLYLHFHSLVCHILKLYSLQNIFKIISEKISGRDRQKDLIKFYTDSNSMNYFEYRDIIIPKDNAYITINCS